MSKKIEVNTTYYRDLNEEINQDVRGGETDFVLTKVYGQRYIGSALQAPVHIDITGTPGNDMAAFMDGASIEVHGNAQDQMGNTMNDGEIIVHGRCGDATGYAMRGGSIFVEEGCGWRCGIHMKEYQDKCPTIVIGGDAGSFLGEYMAGGIIVLLGHSTHYFATGMHGGVIYLAEPLPDDEVNDMLIQEKLDDRDKDIVNGLLERYNGYFDDKRKISKNFRRLRPKSSRPYGGMYT